MKKFICMLCLILMSPVAVADYPEKPITIINLFAPGGLGSNLARILGDGLTAKMGVPVIVEDKPGAGGVVGFNYVKAAKPDGYTVVLGTTSGLSLGPSVNKNLPFDPEKDFEPVALTFTSPNLLVVSSKSPYKSIEDLQHAAKNNPQGLAYATTGYGTTGHILGGSFKAISEGNMIAVGYKGTAPAIIAMIANECDFWFGATDTLPHIESGKLRALAVAAPARFAKLPDVPTTEELGFPELTLESWYGVLAPAKTPKAIVGKLNGAITEVLSTEAVQKQVQLLDTEVSPNTSPEYFAKRIKSDRLRWQPVIQKAGIVVE